MFIRIVTFRLNGIDEDQYRALAEDVAPAFASWPGLQAKLWLADRAGGTYGGIYLFDDRAAAEASRATELFAGMVANPALDDIRVREFDVLEQPTQVTGGPVSRAA
jgi:hypothetical protein